MRRGFNVTGGVIGAAQGIESHVHLGSKYPNDEDKSLQSWWTCWMKQEMNGWMDEWVSG